MRGVKSGLWCYREKEPVFSGGKGDGGRSVFPIQCTFCPGKTDCKGAGRPAGNRICHGKLLYCQIPGNNPAVITVEAIPAPDTEKINYICMYQQKAQNVLKAFCRLEKTTCLYITGKGKGYQKLKAAVSDLHLEEGENHYRMVETSYFMICAIILSARKGKKKAWVPLLQKP